MRYAELCKTPFNHFWTAHCCGDLVRLGFCLIGGLQSAILWRALATV